jgi:hypothetical protein
MGAGMPMPALVFRMPMPTYEYYEDNPYSGGRVVQSMKMALAK